MKSDTYYKIGKNKRKYIVLKCKEYKGRIIYREMYFSNNLLNCINFCKHSNYLMKGFVSYV